MDRLLKKRHLLEAERHVAQGEQHILRQREIVTKIEREGGDTTLSRSLLQRFEDLQMLHLADFDRLLDELATEDAA